MPMECRTRKVAGHVVKLSKRTSPGNRMENRMSAEPIKFCTHCGAEYDASAQECADCGGKLAFRTDERGDIAPLSEEEALALVREGSVGYLREVARELAGQGIRSAIVFHAPGTGT
jgi:hypothetical protein